MKFKRIRGFKGTTIELSIPYSIHIRRVSRAFIHNGNGIPIARFETVMDGNNLICRLSPTASAKLGGTYKYEVIVDDVVGSTALQYGILEVM